MGHSEGSVIVFELSGKCDIRDMLCLLIRQREIKLQWYSEIVREESMDRICGYETMRP